MMANRLFIILSSCFFSFAAFPQYDKLEPLHGNSALMYSTQNIPSTQKTMAAGSLTLPFFDEFSYAGPYANANKWVFPGSQSVFVNHGYPIAPPTIGVVTFDGLNRN